MTIGIVSGFLFLFILVLNLVMASFGYIIDFAKVDVDAELQKIGNNPKNFRISIGLALVEHGCIIVLTILLFITYGPYSLIIGIAWTIFRSGEGLIQFVNEKNYWGLLNIATKYSSSSDNEKKSLRDLTNSILRKKESRFSIAMICWAIGTLAYSIIFVIYELVPLYLGWLGIFASIFVILGNTMKQAKYDNNVFKVLNALGGLSAILFEIILGGWLLLQPMGIIA